MATKITKIKHFRSFPDKNVTTVIAEECFYTNLQKYHDFLDVLKYLNRTGIRTSKNKHLNGITTVSVTISGVTVTAWSFCHWRDQFDKKQGIYEALKKLRALGYDVDELIRPYEDAHTLKEKKRAESARLAAEKREEYKASIAK